MTQKVHSSLSKHLMSDCSGVCTLASSGELFGPPPTPASHPQRVWICCQDHEPQVPLFTAHCLKVYREVGGSDGKESAHSVGDHGSIPESGRSPEKEMVTQSSILAWKIPWTEEPGQLQSMRCRVRHDWATSLSLSCSLKSWLVFIQGGLEFNLRARRKLRNCPILSF